MYSSSVFFCHPDADLDILIGGGNAPDFASRYSVGLEIDRNSAAWVGLTMLRSS